MADVARSSSGVTFDLRTIPPLKEFQFRIDRFAKGITDWSPVLHAYGELFKSQMVMQFETEGAASGEAWTKNEPTYAALKKAQGYGSKIGVRTGALRSSMTGGGGYSEHVTATTGDYGMSADSKAAPYGGYFDYVRPVIRMTPAWGREYQKLTQAWLVAEERGSMGIGGSEIGEGIRLGGGGITHKDWSGA